VFKFSSSGDTCATVPHSLQYCTRKKRGGVHVRIFPWPLRHYFQPPPSPLPSLTPEISSLHSTTLFGCKNTIPPPSHCDEQPLHPASIFDRLALIQGPRGINESSARFNATFPFLNLQGGGFPPVIYVLNFVVAVGIQDRSLDNRPKVVETYARHPQCHRCVSRPQRLLEKPRDPSS
jgi:hypothetical protein